MQPSVIGQVMSSAFPAYSVIGQLTLSCIISDLVCKEQPIKIQYFNIGNNNNPYGRKIRFKQPKLNWYWSLLTLIRLVF